MDETPAEQVAESAPAPELPFDLNTFAAEQPEAYANWQLTGDLPETQTDQRPSPADSAPASPARKQAASTEASREQPASEPGDPTEQLPVDAKERTASRFQELLADRSAQKARADTAEQALRDFHRQPARPDGKADSSTARSANAKPQQTDYDDYEEYIAALSQYAVRQEHTKLRSADDRQHRVDAHFASFEKVAQEAESRLTKAEAADPEFAKKVDSRLLQVQPASLLGPTDPISAQNVIVDEVLRSAHTAELLLHFSAHPEDFDRMSELQDPGRLMWELGRIEASLGGTQESVTRPSPTVSRAPKPPVTLGSKPTEETDPVDRAMRDGDAGAYIREMNQREARALKAG